MNFNSFIIYDFETTSKNPYIAQPTQLAAVAIDGRKLEIQDRWDSYLRIEFDEEKCKKYNLAPFSEEAAKKTNITKETLEKAPEIKVAWKSFENWVNNFNYKKTAWTAPIRVGFNSDNYDDVIINRLCGQEPYKFGPWNEEYSSQDLFHPVYSFDLLKFTWYWMENLPYIKSISMDSLRELMGMSNEAAHNAVFDVEQEAQLFIKYMKLARHYSPKIKFKNAFGNSDKK